MEVKTKPAGARVFLDGEFKGYTPMTLQTLPIGKHVMRLERPGFKLWGTIVEISPEDSDMTQELTPTPGYKAYDAVVDTLAAELLKDKAGGGSAMKGLAKTLGLDRGVVAVLKEVAESGAIEMHIGLFDLKEGKRLAGKRSNFQGDEYGQLQGEIGRVVNHLMNTALGSTDSAKKGGGDPLNYVTGTEEWTGEDTGGKRTRQEKKKNKGDPLDDMSGIGEW